MFTQFNNKGESISIRIPKMKIQKKKTQTTRDTYFLLLPPDQRREADHKGQHPQPGDERLGPPGGHDARVGDGTGDGHVAVERNRAQVQYRRGAHPDVDGQPHAAPHVTEDPYLRKGRRGTEKNVR